MAAHVYIQIATNRRLATRARQYARAIGRRGAAAREREHRLGRERFDFLEEIKAPRYCIGSSIDSSGFVDAINALFRKRIINTINDALIAAVSAELDKQANGDAYLLEDHQHMKDFLLAHKGQRCYAKWW